VARRHFRFQRSVLVCLLAILCSPAAAQRAGRNLTELPSGALQPPSLSKSTDDLGGILAKQTLRVLVVPNLTNYFLDRGSERGLTYDSFTLFGAFLQRTRQLRLKFRVVFVPVSRDEIFQALVDGRGDVAASNLTITETRSRDVEFTFPIVTDVNEIIVSGPGAAPVQTLEDLAGQTVHVRRHTSYFESLSLLNDRLMAAGKPPMRLVLLPDVLENEDKLEMLNAGLIKFAVIEAPLFEFWQRVFPNIQAHPQLAVRRGGTIAWAVRKGNPQLKQVLNQFLTGDYSRSSIAREVILARYLRSTRWIRPIFRKAELDRYNRTVELFRKYSEQYGFDYLLLLAIGFQESRLDQSYVSSQGAIGLMQIMPETGREMDVGNIRQPGPNVHAGARYLRRVMDQYFDEAQLTPLNRMMFAFASYNAGPTRINRLRDEAARLGFNRNEWFGNVEMIVADRVGLEPVHYVRNILKYYVAYSGVNEVVAERDRAKRGLKK
jgi:membrane-bound lytic murein transglycosylase MltF